MIPHVNSALSAQQILLKLRTGIGIDSHRLQSGGPMRVGGIDIACDLEMVGHSDADVLLHAITDAICSAAMLPDIGQLFPDDAELTKAATQQTS